MHPFDENLVNFDREEMNVLIYFPLVFFILSYGLEVQNCRKNVPLMVLVAVTVTQFYEMSR